MHGIRFVVYSARYAEFKEKREIAMNQLEQLFKATVQGYHTSLYQHMPLSDYRNFNVWALSAKNPHNKIWLQIVGIPQFAKLTQTLLDDWLTRGRHHQITYLPGDHDNPDGRIAEDIRIATEVAIDLGHSLTYCILLLISFTNILWMLSGAPEVTVAGYDWADGENVKMCDTREQLIAVGQYDANSKSVHPRVVLGGQ